MADRIKMRRGELLDLPDLDEGEFGLATDVGSVYVGNPAGDGNVLVNPVKECSDGYSIDGYLSPTVDNVHGLGTPDKKWRHLVVGPGRSQSGYGKIFTDAITGNIHQVDESGVEATLTGSASVTYRHDSSNDTLDGYDRYYFANAIGAHADSTTANTTEDRLYVTPFITGEIIRKIDRVGVYCYTASYPTNVFVLGIYDTVSETDLRPNNLIYQTTELAGGSVGMKYVTASIRLEPGRVYWSCYHGDNSESGFRMPTFYGTQVGGILGHSTSAEYTTGFYLDRTYNSTLPDPFPSGTLTNCTSYMPTCMFRYAGY
jgi:hypothetical protein